MAKYILYTYQFAPLIGENSDYPKLFEDAVEESPEIIMHAKQGVFTNLLKKDSELVFTCSDQTYSHKILLNFNGIITLRIANNKKFIQEQDFKLKEIPNHPSCMVIVDNREGFQTIAIEKNSSFPSTDTVARIMKASFNAYLRPYRLYVDIRRRLEENSFWQLVDRYPDGIKKIRFYFAYPNLPRVSDNVEEVFRELALQFNANTQFELTAIEGQTLNLDKEDKRLASMIKASSDSGLPVKVLPAKKKSAWVSSGSGSFVSTTFPDAISEASEDELFHNQYEYLAEEMKKLI